MGRCIKTSRAMAKLLTRSRRRGIPLEAGDRYPADDRSLHDRLLSLMAEFIILTGRSLR